MSAVLLVIFLAIALCPHSGSTVGLIFRNLLALYPLVDATIFGHHIHTEKGNPDIYHHMKLNGLIQLVIRET